MNPTDEDDFDPNAFWAEINNQYLRPKRKSLVATAIDAKTVSGAVGHTGLNALSVDALQGGFVIVKATEL